MTTSQLLFSLTSLSFVLLAMLVWSLYRVRKLQGAVSASSLTRLQMEITELQSQFASLAHSHKRLTARFNMREYRSKQRGEIPDEGGTSPSSNSGGTDRERLREAARARGLMR